MRHAAEPIVAWLQKTRGEGESSTPAEAEGTAKRYYRRTQRDRQDEQGKGGAAGAREWMDGATMYTTPSTVELPAKLQFGKAHNIH